MGNRTTTSLFCAGIAVGCLVVGLYVTVLADSTANVELVEDPPSVAKAQPGDVTGTITPAATIAKLTAVSRVTGKRYEPAVFDCKTGQFRFAALPGDATYDICIETTDGRRIEGIDLGWFEQRFARLAAERRARLKMPPVSTHRFTAADAKAMIGLIAQRKDFSGINRPLYIRGDGGRAVMLVERIRSERFHAAKPDEIIWRTDLMYLTWDAGQWQISANTRRLVERQRFGPDEWSRFSIRYDHRLSAYVDESGASRQLTYTLGDASNPATGRFPAMALDVGARPVVLGVDRPTTQPRRAPGQ